MPTDHVRRGRPKGSGLDDRAQLNAIAQLLATDRSLKPTTAIKRIGVTDPSTIRRLRDKLRSSLGEAPPGHEACAGDEPEDEPADDSIDEPVDEPLARDEQPRIAQKELAPAVTRLLAPVERAELQAVLPEKIDEPKASAPQSGEGRGETSQSPPASDEAAQEWFTQWCALGLNALAQTVEAQRALAEEVLRSPPVASALRNQVRLNEVAKAFCPTSSEVRRRKV